MSTLVKSSDTTIDHVGLVAHDIAALRAAYLRMGFTVTAAAPLMQPGPDGKGEASLGHVSAHVVFPDTYVELTAVRHLGQGSHLDKWLSKREGLHILALHADDAGLSSSELVAAGLILPPLRTSWRQVTSGGVTGTARFRWFELPESVTAEAFTCVVEHQTPDLIFVPSLMAHGNGARSLRGVYAIVKDMDEAFARYQRLPGTKKRSFALGRAIVMSHQKFIVLEPKNFEALFPGVTAMPQPALGAFELGVADIAVTRQVLTDNGVPFHFWGDKGIWVGPEHAGGAVLVFAQDDDAV